MQPHLIVPGRGGSGPDHWQTHWERELLRNVWVRFWRAIATNWPAGMYRDRESPGVHRTPWQADAP